MPFVDKSTLTYPATNAFPVRKWLDTRDPVSGTNGDYKNFQIFDLWINEATPTAWIMVDKTATAGTWLQIATTGSGILSITGDSGGAVGPDGANNINLLTGSNLTVTGVPASNTLTITLDGTVASSYPTDSGTATPSGGILNVVGAGGTNTSGSGNTITVTSGPTVPTSFVTDAGSAIPASNILNVLGDGNITTSGLGDTVTINAGSTIATTYTCDSGSATPALNNLNVFGSGSTTTSASGDTVTITSTGAGLSWNQVNVVGPTAMTADMGYVTNVASPSVCDLTLPLISAFGSVIAVVGQNSGGWSIGQNAGQSIRIVDQVSTAGVTGSVVSSEANATILMVCVQANTAWIAYSTMGNLIIT